MMERQHARIFSLARHALRAPLANLCGYAQLFEDLAIDPTLRARSLAAIRCGAEASLRLVDRWFEAMRALEVVAAEPCTAPPEAPFALAPLIRDAVRAGERLALQRGQRLYLEKAAGHSPWLQRGRESVETALACLLDAARLHLPCGSALALGCAARAGSADIDLARAGGGSPFEPTLLCRQIGEAIELDRGLGVRFHLALAAHCARLAGGALALEREAARLKFPLCAPAGHG